MQLSLVEPKAQEVNQAAIPAPVTPFHALMRGGVRVAAILKAQTPEALAKIEKAVSDSAAACQADRGVQVPMLAGLLPLENASGPHPLLANTQCDRKSRGNSVIRSASKQNLWSA